jgi:hypothetical protein
LDDEEEDWLVHLLLAQIGSLQIEEPSKFWCVTTAWQQNNNNNNNKV